MEMRRRLAEQHIRQVAGFRKWRSAASARSPSAGEPRCRRRWLKTFTRAMSNVRRYLPGRRRSERKFPGKADFQWRRGDRYVTFARTRATPSWIGPGFGSFTEKMRMETPRRSRPTISLRMNVSESRGQALTM